MRFDEPRASTDPSVDLRHGGRRAIGDDEQRATQHAPDDIAEDLAGHWIAPHVEAPLSGGFLRCPSPGPAFERLSGQPSLAAAPRDSRSGGAGVQR